MKDIYLKVIKGNMYDSEMEICHQTEVAEKKVKAKDLPEMEMQFLLKYHKGCSIHYAMTLYKMLYDAGKEAYIAITERDSVVKYKRDIYMSVYYIEDGVNMIADPAEAIKTKKEAYYAIPIEEYRKKYGTIWLYDPYGEYGEKLFFEGFLNHPKDTFYGD